MPNRQTTKKYLCIFLYRAAALIGLFTAIPAFAASYMAFRESSRLTLLAGPIQADPSYFIKCLAAPLLSSLLWAVGIAACSLAFWPPAQTGTIIRSTRILLAVAISGLLLYPAFGASIPGIRELPFWVLYLCCSLTLFLVLRVVGPKPGKMEILYLFCIVILFISNPRPSWGEDDLLKSAGRVLTRSDVVIIGIDSMSYADASSVLQDFHPRGVEKIIYSEAYTPMAMTSAAWRTVFSGVNPKASVLPGDKWGNEEGSWLPHELRKNGYSVRFYQDDPTTNIFGDEEGISLSTEQGWKWVLKTLMWRTLFPLSEVGGGWWVRPLGGPADFSSRNAYRFDDFKESLVREIGKAGSGGPLFVAAHTCFAHTPILLQIDELVGLKGWLSKAPREVVGGHTYISTKSSPDYQAVWSQRKKSAGQNLGKLLRGLESVGVIGRATVIVLSDHGPRAPWVDEHDAHNIMLAVFLPGKQSSKEISIPVSLVDIAPTLRGVLNLPTQYSDGASILEVNQMSGDRNIKILTSFAVRTGAKFLNDPSRLKIEGNIRYLPDGTYLLSPELKDSIVQQIKEEESSLKAIQHWTIGRRAGVLNPARGRESDKPVQ
jgi:hypothetical protein